MKVKQFTMTRHALERALDMCVDGEEIRLCLEDPESVVKSDAHKGYNYRRGRIACGVAEDNAVMTVVWASSDGWREDCDGREYGGREYRG